MRVANGAGLVLIACGLAVSSPHRAHAANAPEEINIPGPDVALYSILYRPDGAGPFPAVVALHGCAGLGKPGGGERERDWAQRLTGLGFVVLFPDSYGSRELGSQCRIQKRSIRTDRERVADAHAARRWLQGQAFVKADRVSLLGWSNGASTVLWAVRPRTSAGPDGPDFRAAVALYPGCRRSNATAWSARIPTLILIGAKDDWTPAQACRQMVDGARGRTAQAAIVVYPGAYHGFDQPNQPIRMLSGIAVSADGSGVVHVGTDPAARADAIKRVPEWLAR